MPTLFQIADEIRALHDLLTEAGGELPDEQAEAAIDEWLAETNVALEKKVNGYVWLIKEFEGRSEARELAAKHLTASAGADLNQAKRLKTRLKEFLEICGLNKLQTEHFKLTIAANGGKAPLVFPEEWEREPAQSPERYHKVAITLDKETLRKEAEETELELAKLSHSFARGEITAQQYNDAMHIADHTNVVRLGERSTHLRIR